MSEPTASPTMDLRFVERECGFDLVTMFPRMIRFLQQRWRITEDCPCGCGVTREYYEWRDIPLEAETP